MESFDLESHLHKVYATFPEASRRPLIGITANYADGDATLRNRYYQQVVAAGGTPVIIPPVADKDVIINTLEGLDGIVLTGGGDYNPLWAGEQPLPQLHGINSERDLPELLLTRLAFNRQIPMLGICRGIQTLALALGGKVAQDIYTPMANGAQGSEGKALVAQIKHSQEADRSLPTHAVNILGGTMLADIYKGSSVQPRKGHASGELTIYVNSFHHQAVSDCGKRFRVTATAPDGIIEAIESNEHKSILGVQWHPEWLEADGLKLFQWLVTRAKLFNEAKSIHRKVLTLDSHCDTPMFFPQGVHFEQRDPRILYDLHKMTDGRQDAVVMVAYLPQPRMGDSFSQCVNLAGIARHNPALAEKYGMLASTKHTPEDNEKPVYQLSPRAYADLIFDKIEEIVHAHPEQLSTARTPAELYEDKRKGRKSIVFGIENGLALEHDLANVKHFAQRGVVYITLCHNGDNDICDSARGVNTHNGVSSFGEKVIKEMNQQGVMIDLSHAGEKSFYDTLQISAQPVVCSHSNSRALCDVPRNLTDDQMRALAAAGGVAQVTMYHGFLRKEGEASIIDAITHLEHAIDIMGIDHVGIGTDFDGDGGVCGMADASEAILFTIQLLRRHYNENDIAKIWGGNWLRVMAQVQASRP